VTANERTNSTEKLALVHVVM